MTATHEPKSEALRALYWKEEILQVMFWVQGEGFGEDMDAATLGRFLGIDAEIGLGYLDRLCENGLLETVEPDRYRLSALGQAEGGKVFSDEFAEFTKPSHGECGAECWCHGSSEEADACAAEQVKAARNH